MNEMTMRRQLQIVKKKLLSNVREIALMLGMVGVGICGFEFGFVQGIRHTSPPIVIEKPTIAEPVVSGDISMVPSSPLLSSDAKTSAAAVSMTSPPVNCPFIGSRNSDKYHAAGCAVVKRIKSENRVCFISEDDAKAKSYQPGCLKP